MAQIPAFRPAPRPSYNPLWRNLTVELRSSAAEGSDKELFDFVLPENLTRREENDLAMNSALNSDVISRKDWYLASSGKDWG